MDLAKEQKLNYGDDMTSVLRQARKKRFQIKEELRINQEIELQSYLNRLIVQDAEKNLTELNERESSGDSDKKDVNGDSVTDSKLTLVRQEIEEKRDTSLAQLNDLFAKVDDNRRVSFHCLYFHLLEEFYANSVIKIAETRSSRLSVRQN